MALKICGNCIYYNGHCNNFKSFYYEMSMKENEGCGKYESEEEKISSPKERVLK